MEPNAKGEITLNICGEDRKLKLTIEALDQLELDMGCGIMTLAVRAGNKDYRLHDVASVLLAGLRGADPATKVTLMEVKRWIMQVKGLPESVGIYAQFLLPVFRAGSTGEKPAGEEVAQTATKT